MISRYKDALPFPERVLHFKRGISLDQLHANLFCKHAIVKICLDAENFADETGHVTLCELD